MSAARAALLRPLKNPVAGQQGALVVGGGVAGMTSALAMAEQGHEVYLLEKAPDLGGMAHRLHYTAGRRGGSTLSQRSHRKKCTDIPRSTWRPMRRSGRRRLCRQFRDQGALARQDQNPATAWRSSPPARRNTSQPSISTARAVAVLTLLELEEKIVERNESGGERVKPAVMINAWAAATDRNNYCSRVCCSGR